MGRDQGLTNSSSLCFGRELFLLQQIVCFIMAGRLAMHVVKNASCNSWGRAEVVQWSESGQGIKMAEWRAAGRRKEKQDVRRTDYVTGWCVGLTIFVVQKQQCFSLCCWSTSDPQRYKHIWCCSTMLSWRIFFAYNDKTYLGLQVKCPIYFPMWNKFGISR